MYLTEFATLELQFRRKRSDAPPGTFQTYLGSGDGLFQSRLLKGTVNWDLYENPGDTGCDAHFVGSVSAGETPIINFEMLGFFHRPLGGTIWTLRAAIRFRSVNDFGARLDQRTGFAAGTFDMTSYGHCYTISLPDAPAATDAIAGQDAT